MSQYNLHLKKITLAVFCRKQEWEEKSGHDCSDPGNSGVWLAAGEEMLKMRNIEEVEMAGFTESERKEGGGRNEV